MIVYVELAFLENFCLDLLLLSLTVYAASGTARICRLFFASALGGVFAVLFPLLSLPQLLAWGLKISFGAFLPLVVLGRKKWGLGAILFFLITFAFGGALLGSAEQLPRWTRFPLSGTLTFMTLVLVAKLYKRRALIRYLYDCVVEAGERRVEAKGFLDSGNFATREGLPVCFLSPDLLYDLFGEKRYLKSGRGGQGCVEMQIFTQAGVKTVQLYRGRISLKNQGTAEWREVYFALGSNMIGREYKIILHTQMEGL